jgi:hypothetical protein
MESLIYLINNLILQRAGGDKFKSIRIVCNDNITRSAPPEKPKDLVSADPTKIIFPGYGQYTDKVNGFNHNLSFDKSPDDVDSMQHGKLNHTFLSIDWLLTLLPKQGEKSDDREKSTDTSVSKLITNVTDAIRDLSGGRFQLSLIADPTNTKSEKNYLITDPSFVNSTEVKSIVPYSLTAVINTSICRNISLSAKVPSGYAAAAYVGNNTPTNDAPTQPPNNTNEPDTSTAGEGDANPFVALGLAKAGMNAAGVTEATVGSLKAALRRVYTYSPMGAAPYSSALPFPLDFSVTLDGIEGFQFGNAITTNYLPSVYKSNGNDVAFTITKIEHSIESNDWSTTLSTVCRVMPSSKYNDPEAAAKVDAQRAEADSKVKQIQETNTKKAEEEQAQREKGTTTQTEVAEKVAENSGGKF